MNLLLQPKFIIQLLETNYNQLGSITTTFVIENFEKKYLNNIKKTVQKLYINKLILGIKVND